METDILVIGGGMAGLTAATKAAEKGLDVTVVMKAMGATAISSGVVDVAGYIYAPEREICIQFASGLEGVRSISKDYPNHPYAIVGGGKNVPAESRVRSSEKVVQDAVKDFLRWMKKVGMPFLGSVKGNMMVMNTLGTVKLTALCSPSIYNGNLRKIRNGSVLFVGINGSPGYDPKFCAKSIQALASRVKEIGIKEAKYAYIDFPGLEGGNSILQVEIARRMDDPENLKKVAKRLKDVAKKKPSDFIAIPPVASAVDPTHNLKVLKEETGCEVFEMISPLQSVPGDRLQRKLEKAAKEAGVRVRSGFEAVDANVSEGKIKSINAKTGSKKFEIAAKAVILATGSFIGGGLEVDGDKWVEYEHVYETLLKLPVFDVSGNSVKWIQVQKLIRNEALPLDGHPVYACGVKVNEKMQPIDVEGKRMYNNLFAAGAVLSGYNYPIEKSGLGVALVTGDVAGLNAATFVKGG